MEGRHIETFDLEVSELLRPIPGDCVTRATLWVPFSVQPDPYRTIDCKTKKALTIARIETPRAVREEGISI